MGAMPARIVRPIVVVDKADARYDAGSVLARGGAQVRMRAEATVENCDPDTGACHIILLHGDVSAAGAYGELIVFGDQDIFRNPLDVWQLGEREQAFRRQTDGHGVDQWKALV